MNPTSNKNAAVVLALGVVVGLAFGYFFGTAVERGEMVDIISTAPVLTDAQKQGAAPLTVEEAQRIEQHRSALVARVRSGVPLTDAERASVARAVLEGGAFYGFSGEEVALLNRALQQ